MSYRPLAGSPIQRNRKTHPLQDALSAHPARVEHPSSLKPGTRDGRDGRGPSKTHSERMEHSNPACGLSEARVVRERVCVPWPPARLARKLTYTDEMANIDRHQPGEF